MDRFCLGAGEVGEGEGGEGGGGGGGAPERRSILPAHAARAPAAPSPEPYFPLGAARGGRELTEHCHWLTVFPPIINSHWQVMYTFTLSLANYFYTLHCHWQVHKLYIYCKLSLEKYFYTLPLASYLYILYLYCTLSLENYFYTLHCVGKLFIYIYIAIGKLFLHLTLPLAST